MLKKLLAVTCLTLSMGAHAAQVIWTFDNVLYEDGSTTVGSFTYDTDLQDVTSANWVTTCGSSSVCKGDLTTDIFIYDDNFNLLESSNTDGSIYDFWNDFEFHRNLGDGPGVVIIVDGYIENSDTGDKEQLMSGTISAVPLPAAAWLFGAALIGLAGIKRKK